MSFQRKSIAPKEAQRLKRKSRIRGVIAGSMERPRLSVFKSGKHVYAQVIDDIAGKTLASASTLHKAHKGDVKDLKPIDAAKKVGEKIALACKEKKIDKVVFDRNGYIYHGRVKVLADAAREHGLQF